MITCSRRIQFCAGHRVLNHESKCANPHGHNYVMWIHARAPGLDSIGRVIDFSVLKQTVGEWVMDNWDHTFIANSEDGKKVVFLLVDIGLTKAASMFCKTLGHEPILKHDQKDGITKRFCRNCHAQVGSPVAYNSSKCERFSFAKHD